MISVILPTYKRYHRLKKAIVSVLNQTYKSFEIIIVDGGCNKKTQQLILSFCDQRIIYLKNNCHTGVSSSRFLGIKNANYSFVSFLDDDDTWRHDKLQLQYNVMVNNPRVDLVLCDYIVNNITTKTKKHISLQKFETNFKNILFSPGPFFQCSLIKKKHVLNNSLYDLKSSPSEDWDFFIELSKKNLLVKNLQKPLFTWNFSCDSQSSNLAQESRAINYIINKHQKHLLRETSYKNLCVLYRWTAHLYVKCNNFSLAKKIYRHSLSWNYCDVKSLVFFVLCCAGGENLIKTYLVQNEK